jgi:hypothetical protein
LAAFLPVRRRLITPSGIYSSAPSPISKALAATAAEFIADERNCTDVPSVVQISEVFE